MWPILPSVPQEVWYNQQVGNCNDIKSIVAIDGKIVHTRAPSGTLASYGLYKDNKWLCCQVSLPSHMVWGNCPTDSIPALSLSSSKFTYQWLWLWGRIRVSLGGLIGPRDRSPLSIIMDFLPITPPVVWCHLKSSSSNPCRLR